MVAFEGVSSAIVEINHDGIGILNSRLAVEELDFPFFGQNTQTPGQFVDHRLAEIAQAVKIDFGGTEIQSPSWASRDSRMSFAAWSNVLDGIQPR